MIRRLCSALSTRIGGAATVFLLACACAQGAAVEEDDDAPSGLDSVVVTATRSAQLVRDQPLRVEVVPDEEIKESLTVAPGSKSSSRMPPRSAIRRPRRLRKSCRAW